jgi:hypothetical protein
VPGGSVMFSTLTGPRISWSTEKAKEWEKIRTDVELAAVVGIP